MIDFNFRSDEDFKELSSSDLLFLKDTSCCGSGNLRPRSFASLQLRALSAVRALKDNPCAHFLLLSISDLADPFFACRDLIKACGGRIVCLNSLSKREFKSLLADKCKPGEIFMISADRLLSSQKRMNFLSSVMEDDLKMIICGNAQDLADVMLLCPRFRNALHADYVVEYAYSPVLLGEITAYLRDLKLCKDLSAEALEILAWRGARLAEDRALMLLDERELIQLLGEASAMTEKDEVDARVLLKAMGAADFRQNYIAQAMMREHRDRRILMETSGSRIGQINGLSVIETSGSCYEYGEPVRITATIKAGGEGEIADIERKAELAGQIHAKAMMIINGFLTREFGSVLPLPASASLVFEQSYSEIDGDSASLTGLCAVLSAYGDLPLRQDLAVTGAVDQFGNVQPVGGLNQKIEGFFKICSLHGLTGTQGVIIPHSCADALVLRPQIITAIEQGKFHIYAVRHVKGALRLFTGAKWGDPQQEKSVVAKIVDRLEGISNRTEDRPWWHFWG